MGWDTSELDRLIGDLDKAGPKAEKLTQLVVKKVAFDTVAAAQAAAPVDTGNLKNSIGQDFDDDGLGFEAGPTAEYGAAIEFGARPHKIYARNGGVLVFPYGGVLQFRRSVNHPGNAPQPYMRPAFEKAVAPVDEVMGQVGEKALE